MVYQSRRWRLWVRMATLAMTSILMLLFAGPVTYALQSDSPRPINLPSQLSDKERSLEGAYVQAHGSPNLARAFATSELLTTQYWIPIEGYSNRLFVRTSDPRYLPSDDYTPKTGLQDVGEVLYTGKVLSLKSQLDADEVVEAMASQGITIDKERVMFISQGEIPSSYRLMVPVAPFLAWAWLAAFAGVVQIARGKQTRLPQRTLLREI